MTNSVSASRLAPEFDDFLFASIGAEKNGMLLSVLSALARMDIDPWQEAARLAGLSREIATHRLASLIAELPDEPSAHPDPVTIATRLIALLPRATTPNPKIPPRKALFGTDAATHPRAVICMYVIVLAFALCAQWIAASRQPATPVDSVRAPAYSTVSPQVQPPNAGQ
jgi:hypothetical protein